MIFILAGPYALKAQEAGGDQEFKSELDNIKSPFDDGIPKPVIINKPAPEAPKPVNIPKPQPRPQPVYSPEIMLPMLNLQGVVVGDGIEQAIIDDQVVPLHGTIEGARVDSVTKHGVELSYKGKKFFLKVD